MRSEPPQSKPSLSKGLIHLQDQYFNNIMDVRTTKNPTPLRTRARPLVEKRKSDYPLSFPQGHGIKVSRYFTLESLFLLVCLTVSLLILPLILPPLPPPPFLLLLLPICILALLMILAFSPSNARDATYTYA